MKRSIALLSALFVVLSPAVTHAWSGGPWSGNTADNKGGKGTYFGTMRGKNLLGVFTFQYSPDRTVNTLLSDLFYVSHEGFSISGSTAAIVDTQGRKVSGVFTSSTTQNGTASGSFNAKMTSTKPQIKFQGNGVFSSEANATITTAASTSFPSNTTTSTTKTRQSTKISVSGVRSSISTGTTSSSNTGTNTNN